MSTSLNLLHPLLAKQDLTLLSRVHLSESHVPCIALCLPMTGASEKVLIKNS
jgi:hypothetical protein